MDQRPFTALIFPLVVLFWLVLLHVQIRLLRFVSFFVTCIAVHWAFWTDAPCMAVLHVKFN
jgi:hypothetical protein